MIWHVVAQAMDMGMQRYKECDCESGTLTRATTIVRTHGLLHACVVGMGTIGALALTFGTFMKGSFVHHKSFYEI